MRMTLIRRSGTLALAFATAIITISPALAAAQEASQSQQAQYSSTGPYDGADFEAAKHSIK